MASPTTLVPWKTNVVFFTLLLLVAFNVSARELVETNVLGRSVRKSSLFHNASSNNINVYFHKSHITICFFSFPIGERAMEMNEVMGRKLIARQLDISWRGNYSPPPPLYPPHPPPPRYSPPPPRNHPRYRSRPRPPPPY